MFEINAQFHTKNHSTIFVITYVGNTYIHALLIDVNWNETKFTLSAMYLPFLFFEIWRLIIDIYSFKSGRLILAVETAIAFYNYVDGSYFQVGRIVKNILFDISLCFYSCLGAALSVRGNFT